MPFFLAVGLVLIPDQLQVVTSVFTFNRLHLSNKQLPRQSDSEEKTIS
jgi:hypothetical protein